MNSANYLISPGQLLTDSVESLKGLTSHMPNIQGQLLTDSVESLKGFTSNMPTIQEQLLTDSVESLKDFTYHMPVIQGQLLKDSVESLKGLTSHMPTLGDIYQTLNELQHSLTNVNLGLSNKERIREVANDLITKIDHQVTINENNVESLYSHMQVKVALLVLKKQLKWISNTCQAQQFEEIDEGFGG